MGLLSDSQIRALISKGSILNSAQAIEYKKQPISTGISSYGYDAALGNTLQVFLPSKGLIDPLEPEFQIAEQSASSLKNEHFILPPHSFALGYTQETFHVPRDVTAICMGKSTYARCGIFVNVTPLESEWKGQVTLEIYNSTPSSVKLYPDAGICQFLFLKGDKPCLVSYADKKGKYQYQTKITHSRSGKTE